MVSTSSRWSIPTTTQIAIAAILLVVVGCGRAAVHITPANPPNRTVVSAVQVQRGPELADDRWEFIQEAEVLPELQGALEQSFQQGAGPALVVVIEEFAASKYVGSAWLDVRAELREGGEVVQRTDLVRIEAQGDRTFFNTGPAMRDHAVRKVFRDAVNRLAGLYM